MTGSLSQIDRAEGRRRILGDRGLQRRTVAICLADGYLRGEVTVALRCVPSLSDSDEITTILHIVVDTPFVAQVHTRYRK